MLLNILQCTGQLLTTNCYPDQNVKSAEVEKLSLWVPRAQRISVPPPPLAHLPSFPQAVEKDLRPVTDVSQG